MLDAATRHLVAEPAPKLPVADLVVGKPIEEVAALLPRLFNLCRAAQSLAANRALGLPLGDVEADVAAEIRRDHLMRFFLIWPRHLGRAAGFLPDGWQTAMDDGFRRALFGAPLRAPERSGDFADFLASDAGLAAPLRQISECFRPGEAVAEGLPAVSSATALDPDAAVENSVAARHLTHPAMAWIEASFGRGPLWRAAARVFDLQAVLDGVQTPLIASKPGSASVAATRGLYSVGAACAEGRVIGFTRVTPTDHLTAPGGILDRALAALPADRGALAPLLMDILDPCWPLKLREVPHA